MANPEKTLAVTFIVALVFVGGTPVLAGKLPTYRALGGTVGLWLLLAILAYPLPDAAAAVAVAFLVAITLAEGDKLLPELQTMLGNGQQKGKAK